MIDYTEKICHTISGDNAFDSIRGKILNIENTSGMK